MEKNIKQKRKTKKDRSHYLFDNKAITKLIIPLIIEQLPGGLRRYGRLYYDSKRRRSGSVRGISCR